MSKEEVVVKEGIVLNLLPNANFKVNLENGNKIIAHISGKMRKNRIKILVGDKVKISMNKYNLNIGRIINRK